MQAQASTMSAQAEMEPLNWRATRDLLAGVDDNPKKCSGNKNNNAKKRWNFALSKVSASRTNNRRSSEDDSQCTGATSKMTDSTAASAAIALPQKFARAARSSISRSKIKGGVVFNNTSQDDYHPTNNNEVEAWMINPNSPIDTIDEHLAAENTNTAPTVDGEQRMVDESTKKIINPQQRILQEMEETVVTLRTQLNYERRGFAIMAMKFKEEKDNMSSQIRDLSWKATLRGKKLSRLEKIVDKCLLLDDATPKKDIGGIKQTSAVPDDNDTMDHSTQEGMNEESVNNRIELLNAEFDRLKISRDEITSKYHDLSQTVQIKYNQLEMEIATFKDMIENLNRFDMLHPTAYGCLFESLNQLGKVEDDLCNLIDYRVVLQGDESLSSVKMMSDHLKSISKVEKRLDDDSDTISPGTESTGATTADTDDMLIFR